MDYEYCYINLFTGANIELVDKRCHDIKSRDIQFQVSFKNEPVSNRYEKNDISHFETTLIVIMINSPSFLDPLEIFIKRSKETSNERGYGSKKREKGEEQGEKKEMR